MRQHFAEADFRKATASNPDLNCVRIARRAGWVEPADRSTVGDRTQIRLSALTRASTLLSERSTPDDPSEVRRNAPPRAFHRTSERSRLGEHRRFHGHVDDIGV
jgi:hypothetical protein